MLNLILWHPKLKKGKDTFIFHTQYLGNLCPGEARSLDSVKSCIYPVYCKYSGFSTRRVNHTGPTMVLMRCYHSLVEQDIMAILKLTHIFRPYSHTHWDCYCDQWTSLAPIKCNRKRLWHLALIVEIQCRQIAAKHVITIKILKVKRITSQCSRLSQDTSRFIIYRWQCWNLQLLI